MRADGTTAVSVNDNDMFRVVLTLINLEEDRISDSQIYRKVNGRIQVVNLPVNINPFVLFSVFANSYPVALRLLSYVISLFFDEADALHRNKNIIYYKDIRKELRKEGKTA